FARAGQRERAHCAGRVERAAGGAARGRARHVRRRLQQSGQRAVLAGPPAALALKLADRARPVACVLGDGGFAMAMAEIETGTRLGLGVRVIVLADDALSQIKAGQERKGYPITGTTFGPMDYPKLG